MGSTGSRPRLSQVVPCCSQGEGGQDRSHPRPQWTHPALPTTMEIGQRRTILPPLKRETTLSTLSESCFAGSLPPTQSNNPSIIHSHPPRRPQALQPLALQIGHADTGSQIPTGRDRRDGHVHRFSTPSQGGHSGDGRLMQGGFLEAQMALSQQVHRHRQTHHCQAQKQRKQKIVYTANVGGPSQEVIRRLQLVRRPTERDIFWDESRGESLDLRSLLQPSPLPPLGQERKHDQTNSQLLHEVGDHLTWRDQAQSILQVPKDGEEGTVQEAGHRLSMDKTLPWSLDREMERIGGRGERSGWKRPEPARGRQRERIRGVYHGMRGMRGIWDPDLSKSTG